MTGLMPSRRRGLTRPVVVLVLGGLALAAAFALDEVVARFIANRPFGYSYDLFTMFRLGGFLPLWGIVAAAFVLIDSRVGWRAAWSRGALIFLAVSLAGAGAEILKLIVRRERPGLDMTGYGYVFRPWEQDAFSTSGLGWPSSHTAVAFAAAWAFAVCILGPRRCGCSSRRAARSPGLRATITSSATGSAARSSAMSSC